MNGQRQNCIAGKSSPVDGQDGYGDISRGTASIPGQPDSRFCVPDAEPLPDAGFYLAIIVLLTFDGLAGALPGEVAVTTVAVVMIHKRIG
jgi:hypothetical protein